MSGGNWRQCALEEEEEEAVCWVTTGRQSGTRALVPWEAGLSTLAGSTGTVHGGGCSSQGRAEGGLQNHDCMGHQLPANLELKLAASLAGVGVGFLPTPTLAN